MPRNDQQTRVWVLHLKLAMKDRSNILDRSADRWSKEGPYFYVDYEMERVCWEIGYVAETLHLYGLGIFNNYDTAIYKKLKKDSTLTFQARMELIINNLCFYKSKCDAVLKGEGIELLVAGPRVKLAQSIKSRKNNIDRAAQFAVGK
jgi:hypothetical protein